MYAQCVDNTRYAYYNSIDVDIRIIRKEKREQLVPVKNFLFYNSPSPIKKSLETSKVIAISLRVGNDGKDFPDL